MAEITTCPHDGSWWVCNEPACSHSCAAKLSKADKAIAVMNAEDKTCPYDGGTCNLAFCEGSLERCFAKQTAMQNEIYLSEAGKVAQKYAVAKDCHYGLYLAGHINGNELWIGREMAAKSWDFDKDGPIGLIIGLLGRPFSGDRVVSGNKLVDNVMEKHGLYYSFELPNIWIDWPDYGIPPMGRTWWDGLMEMLAEVNGPIIVYCFGGHGRTGTMACILGCLSGFIPADADPVHWVRNKYCKNAVESEEQIKYIEKITGREVHDKPAKQAFVYHSASMSTPSHSTSHKTIDMYVLSINAWRKWWKSLPFDKRGPLPGLVRPSDIPDGTVFAYSDGHDYTWNKDERKFRYLGKTPANVPTVVVPSKAGAKTK